MGQAIFIHDGYTLTAEVPAVPDLYPAVTIKYRPAPPSIRWEYAEAGRGEGLATAAGIISRQLIELRVNGDATAIRLSPEDARRLHGELFQSIFNLVMGFTRPRAQGDAEKNSSAGSG